MNRERIQGFSRALILLGLLLIGPMMAGGLAMLLTWLVLGPTPPEPIEWWALHFQTFISQAFGFGGAILIAARLWGRDLTAVWARGGSTVPVLLLAMLVPLVAAPLMEWSHILNTALIPEGSQLESLLKPLEDALEVATLFLVKADGWRRFVVILSVAAVPAVFEELAFRGGLQPLFIRATGRPWLGILVTSLVFSAIHFQFYGFLPRLILGLLFGWMAHRTGSLLPGICAHFVNNAAAAVTLWVTGSMTADFFELQGVWAVLSLVLTAAILFAVDRIAPPQAKAGAIAG